MEKLLCTPLLRSLYFHPPFVEHRGSYKSITYFHRYLTICRNLPFNSFLYAELQIIALYSYEHKGNCTPTECVGRHFDKFSTPLIMLVHFYRTRINVGVNCLKKSLLSKRTNGGGSLRPPR